jgi:hypothetical protein
MSNVVLLRSTPPLFKAYEEVYGILESKYCPSFFKSEEVMYNFFSTHNDKSKRFSANNDIKIAVFHLFTGQKRSRNN